MTDKDADKSLENKPTTQGPAGDNQRANGEGTPGNADFDLELAQCLEAILMVASEPVPLHDLARVLGTEESTVYQALANLAGEYAGTISRAKPSRPHGFVLREVGGGWRFYAHPRFAELVRDFATSTSGGRLTQAALETLAVVAYKQPCTRAQVAAVRGVNVDSVMRNLTLRGLLEEVGTGPSGASLYATTKTFLEQAGLSSLADLPPLAPHLPERSGLDELAQAASENTTKTQNEEPPDPTKVTQDPSQTVLGKESPQ